MGYNGKERWTRMEKDLVTVRFCRRLPKLNIKRYERSQEKVKKSDLDTSGPSALAI